MKMSKDQSDHSRDDITPKIAPKVDRRSFLKGAATEYIEMELEEMEHLFALLVMGFLIGYPVIPPTLTLKLLPYLERESLLMIRRVEMLDDQLGIIGFDID
jgi:hypothetical protein